MWGLLVNQTDKVYLIFSYLFDKARIWLVYLI